MANEVATVSWKKFFVFSAGRTNGAHLELVTKLKGFGQTQVNSFGESNYLLVVCPIVSRVGTDISEALDKLPGGKPAILVVMHHTFNPDHVVAESRRLVNNTNICLTVDCLFYDGRLLKCRRNDTAWRDIQKFLKVSTSQVSIWTRISNLRWIRNRRLVSICTRISNWCWQNPKTSLLALGLVGLAVILTRKWASTYHSLLLQPLFLDLYYYYF